MYVTIIPILMVECVMLSCCHSRWVNTFSCDWFHMCVVMPFLCVCCKTVCHFFKCLGDAVRASQASTSCALAVMCLQAKFSLLNLRQKGATIRSTSCTVTSVRLILPASRLRAWPVLPPPLPQNQLFICVYFADSVLINGSCQTRR